MPKATLTFTLPEEREEFENAQQAGTWKSIVWDLDQFLRSEIKYKDRHELQEIRDKLYDILNDNDLKL